MNKLIEIGQSNSKQDHKNKPVLPKKLDSRRDSDIEYSFDEKEFWNVDENPSRNLGNAIQETRTLQPSYINISPNAMISPENK